MDIVTVHYGNTARCERVFPFVDFDGVYAVLHKTNLHIAMEMRGENFLAILYDKELARVVAVFFIKAIHAFIIPQNESKTNRFAIDFEKKFCYNRENPFGGRL